MKAGTVRSGLLHVQWPALVFGALLASGCSADAAMSPTEVNSGKLLYVNYCAPCHGADGAGVPIAHAPSIGGLPEWYVNNQVTGFRASLRGGHYDDVQGMRMRPMALALSGPDEVAAVAGYVASLPRPEVATTLEGGDAAKGAASYALCTACHGADGKGNETLGAPPLVGVNDWYMLTQLQNFKSGVRGAKPGDTRGATMRPMAATLADEQAMKDVIAHIGTLPR